VFVFCDYTVYCILYTVYGIRLSLLLALFLAGALGLGLGPRLALISVISSVFGFSLFIYYYLVSFLRLLLCLCLCASPVTTFLLLLPSFFLSAFPIPIRPITRFYNVFSFYLYIYIIYI